MEVPTKNDAGQVVADFTEDNDVSHVRPLVEQAQWNASIDQPVDVQTEQEQRVAETENTPQRNIELLENENGATLVVPTPWDSIAPSANNATNSVSPVGEDQESKIQSLANNLADGLQREHGLHSQSSILTNLNMNNDNKRFCSCICTNNSSCTLNTSTGRNTSTRAKEWT